MKNKKSTKIYVKSFKHRPNIDQQIDQKSITNQLKSTKNRGLEGSGAGLEASWAGLGDPMGLESYLGPFWNRLGGLLGGLEPRKVANMGPTWHPNRSKNRLKICPKIDQFYDASWNGFFSVFKLFLVPKIETCWI